MKNNYGKIVVFILFLCVAIIFFVSFLVLETRINLFKICRMENYTWYDGIKEIECNQSSAYETIKENDKCYINCSQQFEMLSTMS